MWRFSHGSCNYRSCAKKEKCHRKFANIAKWAFRRRRDQRSKRGNLNLNDGPKVNVIVSTPSDINEITKSIASASDFVIKLDADEFLGRYMPKAYSKSRCPSNDTHNIFDCRLSPYGVQSLLNELILDGSIFRVGYDQHAVPEQSICEGGLADQFAAVVPE